MGLKCPKCGRRAARVKVYEDNGDRFYVHQKAKKSFCYEIKGCYIKSPLPGRKE